MLGFASSCANTLEEISDLDLLRCLQPMNLSAKISQGQNVTFSWDVSKDATSYTLEVYYDKDMKQLSFSETVEPSNVPFTKYLEVDKEYWFRVMAQNPEKDNSKWAVYEKSVKTYAVKSNLYMDVLARETNAVSLVWTPDPEVDRIEYCQTGSEETSVYTLTETDIQGGCATVSGLAPSTEYDFILYFSSANRGEVVTWTMPDASNLVTVSTSAALIQGIKDGAKMLVALEGSPYFISDGDMAKGLDVSKGFEIYGEGAPDGTKPVIFGCFNIIDSFDGGDIYVEGVEMNGMENTCGFLIQHKEGSATDNVPVGSVLFRNCTIDYYSKGVFYEWGKTMNIKEYGFDSCYIHDVNADGTGGGDGIDIRNATSIDKLVITNNTITNGFRTFLRVDTAPVIGDIVFENNTLVNLCFVDNTNNGGVIAMQVAPKSFSFKNNLFLAMAEKATLTRENTKYITGDNLNIAAANNYFYFTDAAVQASFFTSIFTLAQASGKLLSADPCFNIKGGVYNILGTSEIAGAKIGASKWWAEFVEAPEDLTMITIEGPHTWNFSDGTYFSSDFTKSKVRDGLFFGVTYNKITLADGILGFGSAATTTRKGVPVDGYLAFQVDQPGSLLIKPVDDAGKGNHFVVGVGSTDGSTIIVKGGASAMADMSKAQKVVIKDIVEESIVYIFPSGPISLEQLAWSTDVNDVNTALAAPQPVANPNKVNAGEATDIVISWEPVANAASYSVTFNGKTYESDEVAEGENPRYTINSTTVKMLDAGSYTAQVYANPAADDIYNTMSDAGTAAFAILPAGGSSEEGGAFPVKSLDEFMSALDAQKPSIMLMESGSPYVLADMLTINYPVTISGENANVVVEGGISFPTGTEDAVCVIDGDVTISNLTFDDRTSGKGCFITLTDKMQVGNITVDNVKLVGYSKSAIYGNYAGTTTGDIVFRNATLTNWGTGQGVFDFRKGSYCCLKILESTIVGGRDFIRMDSACSCGDVVIRNNTIDKSNVVANGNGILYVRAKTSSYVVSGNLFLNEVAEGKKVIFSKASGVMVPDMRNNFYYNIDVDNFFSGVITEEIATDGNGVVLQSDPVKDSANGDYTLVSGLAMSCKVGDPRWNPSQVQAGGDSFTVASAEEYDAAISAGKTNITFKAGEYALTIKAIKDLRLTGEGDVKIVGSVDIAGDDLGNLVFDNIYFKCDETNTNGINVSAASTANSVIVRNCYFDGFLKSVWYDNNGLSTSSLVLSNNVVVNHGTGQGVFDIRKGNYTTVTLEQNTIVGGRDLIRADAGTITGAFTFRNNTVDGSNLAVNGNGIMYVRATPAAYIMNNNLFINEVKDGAKVILAKATGITLPTAASTNFFYNIDQENFFSGIFNKEVAAAVEVTNCPVKDAANGDYTLVDALAMASNVGPRRWNPRSGSVTTDFTVNNTEELLNALAVGKSGITMNYGVYDLTAVEGNESVATGILTLTNSVAIKGVEKSGKKPQIIGAIKLGAGVDNFTLQNVVLDGNSRAMGNALEIAGALNSANIIVRACDFKDYSKSAYYNTKDIAGSVNLFSINACTISGFGTGQGVFDIRGGSYTTVIIENSTIYNGGRDFLRADAGLVTNSLAVKNNTFASTGVGAGNGLLWVRSTPNSYVVANNLFVNEVSEGSKTLLAKAGATKATMSNNHFFNCDATNFWSGTYSQEEGTANGGSVLEADPCANSVEFDLTITNKALKDAKVGDPRWR